jgi:hypothetical protein
MLGRTFSDSSLYLERFCSKVLCSAVRWFARVDIRFMAIIPSTALRTVYDNQISKQELGTEKSQCTCLLSVERLLDMWQQISRTTLPSRIGYEVRFIGCELRAADIT